MIIKNKIYNSFGRIESFAGKLVFIFGVATSWVSSYPILLVLGGAFFGFTYLCTTINTETLKVRSGDALFGFIKTGNWIDIKPDMTIRIVKSAKVWKTFSWSNRVNETKDEDYMLALFSPSGKKLIFIKKMATLESAQDELPGFCSLLNLRSTQA